MSNLRASVPVGILLFALGAVGSAPSLLRAAPLQHHAAQASRGEPVDYNRDIRPILSTKCFTCHGADPRQLQAGLRLDLKDVAERPLADGHIAVVPGKPAKSALIARIEASGAMRMPPPGSQKTLNDQERLTLKRWVAQGAIYKQHWAFVKPVRPPVPAVHNRAWAHNGIDYFILARLEKEGLRPSPEASKSALIRRVSLDLTGIPPTPAETRAFLADHSPSAYASVVDRLLGSPAYGERMAMSWLDGARYADSNGYQADFERYQWRWRDWVIDAFNSNMPYDQFAVEQLAGDMLPNATMSQKIASGFNRNHRINTEGGVIPEEWRVETVIDRVETTSQVFLGLTMGCARCHDHKYDPISQKEFYSFYSYFNNVPETGTGVEQPVNHPPLIQAPTPEQERQLAALNATLKQREVERQKLLDVNREHARLWMLSDLDKSNASLSSGIAARYALSAKPAVIAGAAPAPKAVGAVTFTAGQGSGAVVTDGMAYLDLGDVGKFDTHQPFSYGAWLNPKTGNGSPLSRMDTKDNFRGWDIFMQGGKPAAHIVSQWPANALKVTSRTEIPNGRWSHVLVTYDGSAKPEGLHIYVNGVSVPVDVEMNTLTGSIQTAVSAKIGTRTGADGFEGSIEDAALYTRALSAQDAAALAQDSAARGLLATPPEKRTEEQNLQVTRLWSERNDPAYQSATARWNEAVKARDMEASKVTSVMVMDEMPKPRDCFVLVRGQYDKHGDVVTAGLPAALPRLPAGAPNNRLGLARWIASADNPLTARVAVNRLWEKFFGTGIVTTSEDFGTRAEFPSHPELLDWLATEFVRLKWDLKAMQKEIVMSATYRQSAVVTPELMRRDPENRLLARAPRFRLLAETIRDQALCAAGLLTRQVGGRSVRPYQPDGIWDETNVYGNLRNYKHDTDANLYRRSLYTIWKRTAPPPNMTLFDAAGRETCRVRRSRTNTPLQALDLMNEVTYLEAARVLAQRMLLEGGKTPESRISYGMLRLLCRPAAPAEVRLLSAGLSKRLAYYRSKPDAAASLTRVGDYPRDPHVSVPELAAYTMTASVLLNLDETVTKE